MNQDTFLWRQVHPDWVHEGRPTRQTFDPMGKKEISVSDGDMISAEDVWSKHVHTFNRKSVGVLSVTVADCEDNELSVRPDPVDNAPEHVAVIYPAAAKTQIRAVSEILLDRSLQHGWKYAAENQVRPRL